jgi:hypothetical protein
MKRDVTKAPPVALVKTWIDLAMSSESDDVKKRASRMLVQAFGDMETVIAFAKEHGLISEQDKPS